MNKIKVEKLLSIGQSKYAPVKERILALRASDHRYSLTTLTEFIIAANGWLCRATLIIIDTGETYVGESFVQSNRGTTIQRNFPVEDCSTSAIGRAFAAAGIGIDEAFASYEEMQKATELAKTQPDAKVAEAIKDLNTVVERKKEKSKPEIIGEGEMGYDDSGATGVQDKAFEWAPEPESFKQDQGPQPSPSPEIDRNVPINLETTDKSALTVTDPFGTVQEMPTGPSPACGCSPGPKGVEGPSGSVPENESISDWEKRVSKVAANLNSENQPFQKKQASEQELRSDKQPIIERVTYDKEKRELVTREEVAADNSPLMTGNWDEEPESSKKDAIASHLTGKGVTDHMREVYVRLMEVGIDPTAYPERNTDKKFDALEQAWNRGEQEFIIFVTQQWGMKYAKVHKGVPAGNPAIVDQDGFAPEPKKEAKKSMVIDESGKTLETAIKETINSYAEPSFEDEFAPAMPKKAVAKESPKQEEDMEVSNSRGLQPNAAFFDKEKGGSLAQNVDHTGNKFGVEIISEDDRGKPMLFTKWVVQLVKHGIDVEKLENLFEKHMLSSKYPSFEAMLRTGTKEHINEFLNKH